jgi:glycosyltransferase involved in cell wall biosynthesis
MKNKTILLFVKIPPPVTGATLMNKRVHDSKLLRKHFDIRSICISYSNSVLEMGNLSFKKILKIMSVFLSLLRELIFHKPELIYFQISPLRLGFYRDMIFVFLIKMFKVKIVYHLRAKGIRDQSANHLWKKKLYEFAFKGEDIICLSYLLTYDVRDVHKSRIYIVNNGLPDIDKRYRKNRNDSFGKEARVLYLSNLIRSKGIEDYIESLAVLERKGISFRGIIIGADADMTGKDLIKLIKSKKLETKIEYLGKKYDSEKFDILNKADIMVFPTKMKHECFPGVAIEGMQFSIPVIATKEAALPDIIDDGVNGFLVSINSPDQIAEKLEILINDQELCQSMGRAGRKKYEEKYTFECFEQNMKKVFNDVLKRLNKMR